MRSRPGIPGLILLALAIGGVILVVRLGSAAAPPPVTPSVVPSSSVPSPARPSAPIASGSEVVQLVGAGDIGVCGSENDEQTSVLVDGLAGTVFTLGDLAYDQGSEQQFEDCFGSSWGRFKDRIAFPVPGNHEYETAGAAGYRAYFGDAATPGGETWYSRDIGSWHVIVLDATCARVRGGCEPGSPQDAWLRADLATDGARCTLALWHQPRFSSGAHGDDETVAPFWDALYAAGADLVLNSHDHDFERFAAQAPDGSADEARGITQIVVRTGGAELRSFEAIRPNSVARSDQAHGVLQLTLGEDGWSSRFIATDGSSVDDAAGRCH